MTKTILIVDDEPVYSKAISQFLTKKGYRCLQCDNSSEAIDLFVSKGSTKEGISYREIDVMLLDLSMPLIDGFEVLKILSPIKGSLEIMVLTANIDPSLSFKAIDLGATDYITKGEKDFYTRVETSLINVIEKANLRKRVGNLLRKSQNQVLFSDTFVKA